MQRFGLSDLIGALKEEASSSQFLKSACLDLSCGSIFLMVLYFLHPGLFSVPSLCHLVYVKLRAYQVINYTYQPKSQ